jgi:hypothetical protein
MAEEKLEYTKLRERIQKAIEIVKECSKREGLDFDKDLFLEACKLGETLFVRSEIQYAGGKAKL